MQPILTGRRMTLVPLERVHLATRVAFINDPEVQKTLNFDFPTSLARTEAWFQKVIGSRDRVDFAFRKNDNGDIIGFGGLLSIDQRAKKSELYILIGDRSVWGEGYGRDGYKLITNYSFLELGLNKIYLYQLSCNKKAIKATESLGWSVDGLLRKDVFSHGEIKDQYILSILRGEWEKNESYLDA